MSDWFFPTAFSHWGRGERAAIDRVIRSDHYTMGAEVEVFEHEFAEWHGRKHGIMVNSGSSANLVAAAALAALEGGQPVAVPSIAWATTYAPLVQLGYLVELVADCDGTWNSPDCDVACSVLGNALAVQQQDAPPLIEDTCESVGARNSAGDLMGTIGLLSTFSFFYSHQISAIEGGMVLTDDAELAERCRLLRNHGNEGWGESDIEGQYNFTLFGYNLRPLELHAAIAREQLKKLPGMIAARVDNAWYFRGFTMNVIHQEWLPGTKPSPFGLAFRVETKELRSELAFALKSEGIDCRLPTGGSFTKHAYGAPWREQWPTPHADLIHDTGMFLGCPPYEAPALIEKAAAVIKKVVG